MTYYQSTSIPPHNSQNQESSNAIDSVEEIRTKEAFLKRILIVDDEPDVTLTFSVGLEGYYHYQDNERIRFEVYAYNDPAIALSKFKPNFYDLLLTDINMSQMDGFELCEKILELDVNLKVCFMSAAEVNIEALRQICPKVSFGCFIQKPVEIEYLAKRLEAELY
jgi:CheY-like chemotaxis protein